jgi:uncharacterized repeat protein (TIGR01451 family)
MVLKSTLLKIYEKSNGIEWRDFAERLIYAFILFYFLGTTYVQAYNKNDEHKVRQSEYSQVAADTSCHFWADYTGILITGSPDSISLISNINLGNGLKGTLIRKHSGTSSGANPMKIEEHNFSFSGIYTPVGSPTQAAIVEGLFSFNNDTTYADYELIISEPVQELIFHLQNIDFLRVQFTGNHIETLLSGGSEFVYDLSCRQLYDLNPATHTNPIRDGYGSVKITGLSGQPFNVIKFRRIDEPNTNAQPDGSYMTFSRELECSSPSLTLVKSGLLNQNGDAIIYTFQVKNAGNVAINNIELVDSLITPSVINLDKENLLPGDSATAEVIYTIKEADYARTYIENTAIVKGMSVNNEVVTDVSGTETDNDEPTIVQIPKCLVIKDTLFFEDFGKSTVRISSGYMPEDSFMFGTGYDPQSVNNNNYASRIPDNYYAVVAPGYIRTTWAPSESGYFWTPAFNASNATYDMSGEHDGAVMVVNAGTTLSPFYEREATLGGEKNYKLSFGMYLVNRPAQLRLRVMDKSGHVLGEIPSRSFLGTDSEEGGNTYRKWVTTDLLFATPLNFNDKVIISIQNNLSRTSGNDFYIDNILLEEIGGDCIQDSIPVIESPRYADLFIEKSINNSSVSSGDTVTFNIKVKNNGPDTAKKIVVKDSLSSGYTFSNATFTTGTWNYPLLNVDSLASGDSLSLTISAIVLSEGDYHNTASVISDITDANPGNNESTVYTMPLNPSVALVKSGTLSSDQKTIMYNFLVINTGNTVIDSVRVTDEKLNLSNILLDKEFLQPGESTIGTAVYTVTADDRSAGRIINTAIVTGMSSDGIIVQDTSGTSADNNTPTEIFIEPCPANAVSNGTFDNDLIGWNLGTGWELKDFGGERRLANYRGELSGVDTQTGTSLEQSLSKVHINAQGYMLLTFNFRFTFCQGCSNDLFHASLEVVYDGITYARFQNGYLIPINGEPFNGAILETTPDLPFATQSNSNSGSMLNVKLLIPTSNPNGILSFVHNKGGGEDDLNLDNVYVEALCPLQCPEGVNCFEVKTIRIK